MPRQLSNSLIWVPAQFLSEYCFCFSWHYWWRTWDNRSKRTVSFPKIVTCTWASNAYKPSYVHQICNLGLYKVAQIWLIYIRTVFKRQAVDFAKRFKTYISQKTISKWKGCLTPDLSKHGQSASVPGPLVFNVQPFPSAHSGNHHW